MVRLPKSTSPERGARRIILTKGVFSMTEIRERQIKTVTAPAPAPLPSLQEAEAAVGDARHEARLARLELTETRGAVAAALTAWNVAQPAMTPEENTRAWLASNQAEKARLAKERGAPWHPNVTQTARAMSGGNQRRGGGSAYRRGPEGQRAYSVTQAANINAELARVAKLPSR